MKVASALQSQYRAALRTLLAVMEACPEEHWYNPSDGGALYWRVTYHTLFYCHFFLHQKQEDFKPWDRHQPEANYIATVAHENHRPPKSCEPYSQADLKAYWQIVYDEVDSRIDALDLSAPQCGFPWYQMPTLEHQLVNIRHIQHHAAILSWRLRSVSGKALGWVGKG